MKEMLLPARRRRRVVHSNMGAASTYQAGPLPNHLPFVSPARYQKLGPSGGGPTGARGWASGATAILPFALPCGIYWYLVATYRSRPYPCFWRTDTRVQYHAMVTVTRADRCTVVSTLYYYTTSGRGIQVHGCGHFLVHVHLQ